MSRKTCEKRASASRSSAQPERRHRAHRTKPRSALAAKPRSAPADLNSGRMSSACWSLSAGRARSIASAETSKQQAELTKGTVRFWTRASLPSQPSVVYDRPVVVGEALPDTITVYPVPRYRDYEYAIVNNHRVIIDPRTRRVVRVIEE
jgi:hypothetical protein